MDDYLRADKTVCALLTGLAICMLPMMAERVDAQEAAPVTASVPQSAAPIPAPQPQVLRGPVGSQLVAVRPSPSYTSAIGSMLGMSDQPSSDTELNEYFRSTSRRRLIRVPEMFGDFRRLLPNGLADEGGNTISGEIPQSGGISGLKVAENNQAITSDRAWFSYNHMHDAFRLTDPATGQSQTYSGNRYMVGVERTLADGAWSVEMRMPFAGSIDEENIQAGSYGDMSLIVKHLLVADRCHARSVGVGFELPTGSTGSIGVQDSIMELESDAVHLVPFYAETRRIGTRMFANVFSQIDLPLSDDDIRIDGSAVGSVRAAYTSSSDFGLGYWLVPLEHSNDSGLAAVIEGHYTRRLGDVDQKALPQFPSSLSSVNRQDVDDSIFNVTVGVHAQLSGAWSIRLAESFPVLNDDLFDSEAIFQAIRTF
ncbi:MAG: hypothetical protein WBD20_25425 [Pirellulaceae bacterium]